MKRFKPWFVAVAAGILVLSTGAFAYANNIQVFFQNISLVVNGATVSMPDAQPFIYNGHVYLPIRYVSQALGLPVNWDGSSHTVYVGKQPSGTNFATLTPYYFSCSTTDFYTANTTQNPATITMGGQNYQNGIQMQTQCWNKGTFPQPPSDTFRWNLNSQYNTLQGTLGLDDAENTDTATVTFEGDGHAIQKFTLAPGSLPQPIVIPLTGVNQLTIVVTDTTPSGSGNAGFPGNCYVDLVNATLN